MGSPNTRRWPRYHVHIPVFISNETDVSTVAVPGVVSEISRAGMELYGGVQRRPGDLMEVEFQAAGIPRIAGVVRSCSGFCFGLEFLALMPGEPTTMAQPDQLARQDGRLTLGELGMNQKGQGALGAKEIDSDDAVFVEIFLDRHDTYLREAQLEIQSLRQRAQKIKQWREEIDGLLRSGFGAQSAVDGIDEKLKLPE
jgi:hypothetical protein